MKAPDKLFTELKLPYANISFIFDYDPDAKVRITFSEGFPESYIGINGLFALKNAVKMNLYLTPSYGVQKSCSATF